MCSCADIVHNPMTLNRSMIIHCTFEAVNITAGPPQWLDNGLSCIVAGPYWPCVYSRLSLFCTYKVVYSAHSFTYTKEVSLVTRLGNVLRRNVYSWFVWLAG